MEQSIVRYASDMRWKPGEWPMHFHYDGRDWRFDRRVRTPDGGDVAAFVYVNGVNEKRQELHVLND